MHSVHNVQQIVSSTCRMLTLANAQSEELNICEQDGSRYNILIVFYILPYPSPFVQNAGGNPSSSAIPVQTIFYNFSPII